MPITLVPLALLLAAAPAAGTARTHPDVAPQASDDACQSCHAEATPEIVRAWESGPHGLFLVKCFVCHGSTAGGFTRRPEPRRCEGCHAPQVASATRKVGARAPEATDCFSCHEPHGLAARPDRPSPHSAR